MKTLVSLGTPTGPFFVILERGEVVGFGWTRPGGFSREPGLLSRPARRFIRSLEDYFSTGRWDFSWFRLPPPPRPLPLRTSAVLALLRDSVGCGQLTSYGELARAGGTSPRGVGRIMASNPWPVVVPCHRVVRSDGSLGGYSGGLDRKRWLLELEGIRTSGGRALFPRP